MRFNRSIRWWLQFWQFILLGSVLAILLSLHFQMRKTELIGMVDDELQKAVLYGMPAILPRQVGPGPPGWESPQQNWPPQRPEKRNQVRVEGRQYLELAAQNGLYWCKWGPQGRLRDSMGPVPNGLTNAPPEETSIEITNRTRSGNRELLVWHPDGVCLLFGKSIKPETLILSQLRLKLFAIGFITLVMGYLLNHFLTGHALRPIARISETARQISKGEHGKRIALEAAPAELESLAKTLNASFDHLNSSLDREKRFSADAAHELRTPISIVIAQAEATLKRVREPGQYVEALEACLRAGRRMKNMTASLLQLARLENGTDNPACGTIELNALVADAFNSFHPDPDKFPVHFNRHGDPVSVIVDREQILQVIQNLLGNAVEHNPNGCSIWLEILKSDPDCLISIRDDGIGIDKRHLPKLFDRFYRPDPSRSRELGGAGLGLSIAKSLIEANNGDVSVDSEPGKGTVFRIRFPAVVIPG